MRVGLLMLLLTSTATAAAAQSQSAQTSVSMPAETAPLSPLEAAPNEVAAPLAGKGESRIISKNEAYNLARAAERRLGVRLGNDMSFRVTGN